MQIQLVLTPLPPTSPHLRPCKVAKKQLKQRKREVKKLIFIGQRLVQNFTFADQCDERIKELRKEIKKLEKEGELEQKAELVKIKNPFSCKTGCNEAEVFNKYVVGERKAWQGALSASSGRGVRCSVGDDVEDGSGLGDKGSAVDVDEYEERGVLMGVVMSMMGVTMAVALTVVTVVAGMMLPK